MTAAGRKKEKTAEYSITWTEGILKTMRKRGLQEDREELRRMAINS